MRGQRSGLSTSHSVTTISGSLRWSSSRLPPAISTHAYSQYLAEQGGNIRLAGHIRRTTWPTIPTKMTLRVGRTSAGDLQSGRIGLTLTTNLERGVGMTDKTAEQQKPEHLFKPGQSGNPAGRPKGARNKLGEDFLNDLHADWAEHGKQAIEDMRKDKAADYVKVVAATLPRELNVKVSELDELTDEQIARQLAAGLAALAAAGFDIGAGNRPQEAAQPAAGLSTLQ